MPYNPVQSFDVPSAQNNNSSYLGYLSPAANLLPNSTQNSIWEWLFGSPERLQQLQRFNPEQQQAFSKILQQAMGGLGGLESGVPQPNYEGFEPIADYARTQFEQQGIPSIAERFTGMGGQRSGAFAQQLGAARAGLEGQLGALRSQYGLGQQQLGLQERGMRQNLYQGLLGQGLSPQYENIFRPATAGFIPGLANSAAAGLGRAAGSAAMGGI